MLCSAANAQQFPKTEWAKQGAELRNHGRRLFVRRKGIHRNPFSRCFMAWMRLCLLGKEPHTSPAGWQPLCLSAVEWQPCSKIVLTYLEDGKCQAEAGELRLLSLARQELCVTAHVSWCVHHARKCCCSLPAWGYCNNRRIIAELQKLVRFCLSKCWKSETLLLW